MHRLEQTLLYVLIAIVFLNVFWDNFPTIPVLYGCVTAASVLFGQSCLVSRKLPATQAGRSVPENVRRRWCRTLGILYLVNAALCPLGFLLWWFLRFDQDFILLAQLFGFLAICFASLIPALYAAKK